MEHSMKTIIIFSIVLELLLAHSSLFAQFQPDSSEDSVSGARQEFLTVDIAGFPLNHTHSGSWKPNQSFRVGYGYDIVYPFELRVFAEYYKFDFDDHDGLAYQDYSRGQRLDYAIYPAIVAFGIAEFALGGYYTIQDEVIHRSVFSPQPTIDPVVKKLGVYVHLGVGGTIHIIGPLSCSLGIFWRNVPLGGSTYFGGRAGLRVKI
jgi:hypothetical protein